MATTGAPSPEPAGSGPLPGVRIALWLVLGLVLAGLVAIWLFAGGLQRGRQAELPVLGQVPAFELVSQTGAAVTREDLLGRPWVGSLIFTRCVLTCPKITARMVALGPDLDPEVRRVSVSVDPAFDTPAVLADYARSYGIDDPSWLFLTGPEPQMRRLVVDGLMMGVSETPTDAPNREQEPITHSTRFVLVDAAGNVRGYYDGFDPDELKRLASDANRLAREPG